MQSASIPLSAIAYGKIRLPTSNGKSSAADHESTELLNSRAQEHANAIYPLATMHR